jgi:hypothetical protein
MEILSKQLTKHNKDMRVWSFEHARSYLHPSLFERFGDSNIFGQNDLVMFTPGYLTWVGVWSLDAFNSTTLRLYCFTEQGKHEVAVLVPVWRAFCAQFLPALSTRVLVFPFHAHVKYNIN